MADPQYPKPKKPWCSKCLAHTKYKTEIEVRSSDRGSYNARLRYCEDCGEEMAVPNTFKSKFVDSTKGLSICTLILLIAAYLLERFGVVDEGPEGFNIYLVIPVVTFCMWLLNLPSYLAYHKWRRWAEERGWEEGEILK